MQKRKISPKSIQDRNKPIPRINPSAMSLIVPLLSFYKDDFGIK